MISRVRLAGLDTSMEEEGANLHNSDCNWGTGKQKKGFPRGVRTQGEGDILPCLLNDRLKNTNGPFAKH